jgi:putative FmdB family regulatory protein
VPIYEFMCRACGNEFERIQSFSDTSVPACPNCSSEEVDRRLGRPAIHFKGSGWYITDSKNGSKQSAVGDSDNGRSAASNGSASSEKNGAGEKSTEKSADKPAVPAASTSSSSE